jgi:hypothetical protein
MGLIKCNLVLPAALMLCQGSLFAATPLAPAPLKALAAEAQGEEKKAFEGGLEALERRLGGLAADHLKAIAADTEIRMNGYLGDFKLLTTGIYYGNAYAEALQAKGQTERYNHLRDRGAFYHGFASPKHFTLEPSILSPTGKTPLQFLLKPGVAPSAALDSFRTGIALLDCGSTAQLSYYEALRGVLGQDKFDALFAAGSRTPLRLCPTFMANCPITPLFRLVPSDAPFRRGQYVSFAGIPDYQVKHLNGDATNFNVLCEDPGMPGNERFIGLGLSGLGMDRSGID